MVALMVAAAGAAALIAIAIARHHEATAVANARGYSYVQGAHAASTPVTVATAAGRCPLIDVRRRAVQRCRVAGRTVLASVSLAHGLVLEPAGRPAVR
ncbi:MAG: hypothetical protein ACR2NB_00785 [Solirubrobacteraceae bacterium]